MYKENPLTRIDEPKTRGTWDGGKCNGVITLEETYATCVNQTSYHLTRTLYTTLDHVCVGYDEGNDFDEAPQLKGEPYYMRVDSQFNKWWTQPLSQQPIPEGQVIHVLHALQGHPESPRLWH